MPFYGVEYTSATNGSTIGGPGTFNNNTTPYTQILSAIAGGGFQTYQDTNSSDANGASAWAWNSSSSSEIWYEYDNPAAIAEKIAYAKSAGLAGVGAWNLQFDTTGGTLTSAMNLGTTTLPSHVGVYEPTASSCGGPYWDLDSNGDLSQDTGDSTACFGHTGDLQVTGDWNGSGKTKIGVARPSDSNCSGGLGWYLDVNGDLAWDSGDEATCFGIAGDVPVVGDWNGNGTAKIGVMRPHDSNCGGGLGWYLDVNGDYIWDSGDRATCFGIANDTGVVGHWTASAVTKIGIYRMSDGNCSGGIGWYLDTNGSYAWDSGDQSGCFGLAGDQPAVGDWTGNGVTKIGVARKNDPNYSYGLGWYLDMNASLSWDSGDKSGWFGLSNDTPVVGDWTGTGVVRVGVFRPSGSSCASGTGGWYLDLNGDLEYENTDQTGCFGASSGTAIVGKW